MLYEKSENRFMLAWLDSSHHKLSKVDGIV